jgi:hypothetical protein
MKRLALVVLVGCAGPQTSLGPQRYHNADPVTLVNDRKPIPKVPAFEQGLVEYYVRSDFIKPTERALKIEPSRRAENVNSLGNVPDSTWFTNRQVTPEQVRRGPGRGGPDRREPWRVVGVKVGGAAIGIMIADARDDRYVIKFDERGFPEAETSADVVVQRLTWAMGYNVPDNDIVTFRRSDLVLDPKAEVKFRSGDARPMTTEDLDKYLAMVEHEGETYRALASKLIGGTIVGGVEPEGTRKDDPNDRVPHELRRDLRGQRLLWAWVNHIDLKSQNTLATYTDEGYVKWYALDFGESLGVGALTTGTPRLGYRATFSIPGFLTSLLSFGLRVEPYERRSVPTLRGLGSFDADSFDPAGWQANHLWRPIDAADRFDDFWAAEIMMRFTRAHVQAAVDAGAYSEQRTRAYLVDALVKRQRKIGWYAFSRVAPLTSVSVRQTNALELCFDDLWLAYAYGRPQASAYRTRVFDTAGHALAHKSAWQPAARARTCIAELPLGAQQDNYTIVELEVKRGKRKLPPVFVHVARGPKGLRVIGIDRR